MIRIRLEEDRVPVRVGISPYHNLLAALALIIAGADRENTPVWGEMLRARLDEAGARSDALRLFEQGRYMFLPSALLPEPSTGTAVFAAEVAAIRASAPVAIREELRDVLGDDVPHALRPFVDDPAGALADYCDAIERAWHAMLEPDWRRLLSLLEREVLLVSRSVAYEGLGVALPRLHARVRYEPGWLLLDVPGDSVHELGDRYLLLVPYAVGESRILWNLDREDLVHLGYPAPGMMAFWERGELSYSQRFASIVGLPRARIMSALAAPMTQTDLTGALHLSNGAVALQLRLLYQSGLLTRTRVSRRIYYQLSDTGSQLVALFGE